MSDEKEKLEYEKCRLIKLYRLRDYLWGNFSKSDEISRQLFHLVETAISEQMDTIAILEGCKITKSNKRKKYVFEVGRNRLGAADIYLNGELLVSLMDEVIKVSDENVIHTDIVRGMGSRIPDAFFVKALLYSPTDEKCHLSDKVKAVLDRDIPKVILEEQARNIARYKKEDGH